MGTVEIVFGNCQILRHEWSGRIAVFGATSKSRNGVFRRCKDKVEVNRIDTFKYNDKANKLYYEFQVWKKPPYILLCKKINGKWREVKPEWVDCK